MSPLTYASAPTSEATTATRPSRLQVAYLLSRYPAFSHTFILNEIRELRQIGLDIVTASINPCDRDVSQLEEPERSEQAKTFYVKQAGIAALLKAVIWAVCTHPVGVLRGLHFTLRLGGGLIRWFYFVEGLLIGSWMHRHGRSHLHVHFGGPVASVAMIAARTFPITMSFTVHGPDEFYEVSKFYLRQKIETASFVCCISSFARSQLMLLTSPADWSKLIVCRLGVDPARFVPQPEISTRPLEITCVGRLVGVKGQHILLAAFRRLLDQGRDVRLRLVGDGPERQNLEALASNYQLKDYVSFEGAVGADRVRTLLGSTAIFALPSFAEGIPVALMEAMAMEIPCVSTTIAGIPELIRNEVDGLLVAPSDEEQLAVALARLIDDASLRRYLGVSARKRVQEQYNLQPSVKRLSEIFECQL